MSVLWIHGVSRVVVLQRTVGAPGNVTGDVRSICDMRSYEVADTVAVRVGLNARLGPRSVDNSRGWNPSRQKSVCGRSHDLVRIPTVSDSVDEIVGVCIVPDCGADKELVVGPEAGEFVDVGDAVVCRTG